MAQGLYEVVTTRSGAKSIRNVLLNETMHNPVGPWDEANTLYIRPSRLKERLLAATPTALVVFDVGLGAAANAVAAICAAMAAACEGNPRPLHLVSFEKDLDLLAFALENAAAFPHFEGLVPALSSILHTFHWTSPCGRIIWDLHPGNFLETIESVSLRPDIIFHDPYSPAANTDMWDVPCFTKLRRAAGEKGEPTTLWTYSIATHVRTAMLLAGFYVGHGPRTGLKHETTQAATHLTALDEPLGERWLARWTRSPTKYPPGTSPDQLEAVTHAVLMHPQFASLAPRGAAEPSGSSS